MANEIELNANIKSNVGEVAKGASDLASEFKIMGVSVNSVKKGLVAMGATAKKSFATIKAGIASTGIGALVIAFGALTQYFRDSEEGASKFKQITSQLGVVVGNVTDIISDLGKSVFKLITGDFKGFKDGLAEVTQGVKDFGETTRKEMKQANQLEKDRLALQKFERDAIVEKARTEKDIMELRLKARDFEKFSSEERLGFMREANKLAAEQLQKDLHVAKEKLRFQQEENSFSKSTQENLDAEAQLQAQVFQIERSNFSERKRMKSEEQAIVREIQAKTKAEEKAIADAKAKADKEAKDKEIADAKAIADAKIAEEKRIAAEALELQKATEIAKENLISSGFAAASALAGESDKAQKAVAVAKTIYNTQQAIMNAMANVPAPFNIAQAALTGIMGANAIRKILSTSPESNDGDSTTVTAATPATEFVGSGTFQLSNAQPRMQPVQAFVVTDDMTNSQDKLALIRRRATI